MLFRNADLNEINLVDALFKCLSIYYRLQKRQQVCNNSISYARPFCKSMLSEFAQVHDQRSQQVNPRPILAIEQPTDRPTEKQKPVTLLFRNCFIVTTVICNTTNARELSICRSAQFNRSRKRLAVLFFPHFCIPHCCVKKSNTLHVLLALQTNKN